MIKWSEEQEMVRQAVRDFVDSEIRPHRDELEFGDMAPYDLLRKMFRTFGMDAMARDSFAKRIERETADGGESGGEASVSPRETRRVESGRDANSRRLLDDPDHRVVPGMSRDGHRDGCFDGAHRRG